MTSPSTPTLAVGEKYWAYLVARAVPAALVAVFITFSADHSVRVGWVSLLVLAAATGVIVAIGSARMLRGLPRTALVMQGAVLVIVAVVAAAIAALATNAPLGVFTVVLAAAVIVSGALELFAGLRSRGELPVARDWIFLGAGSIVFGIAVLLVPVDYSQAISVPGKVLPNLTASVVVVGMLGAYTAIVAVYLVIAGLSLKWAKHPDRVVSVGESS